MSARRKPRSPSSRPQDAALVLHAVGVSKRIDETVLLAPVDVAARAGACVVLRGANGSGKTTLLRILAGTIEPSAGKVTLDDAVVDEREPRTREALAALIGAPATYRDLTLADHLVLIDSTWGGDRDTAGDRVHDMLALLGIDHLAQRFPHELSSGQQQLFNLSMALLRPCRVMVLDEPEQRLDPEKRELLTRILLERKTSGQTIVIACHDPVMTDALTSAPGDRVIDIAPA